jgi:hypothetical protein
VIPADPAMAARIRSALLKVSNIIEELGPLEVSEEQQLSGGLFGISLAHAKHGGVPVRCVHESVDMAYRPPDGDGHNGGHHDEGR